MKKTCILFLLSLVLCPMIMIGQEPRYTPKKLVGSYDSTLFKPIIPKKDGPLKTYIVADIQVWDIDDNNTTSIMGHGVTLLCIEGQYKNHKRDGLFRAYAIDSADHSKRYKVWEQHYVNDKLNGEWLTYTLRGTLASIQTFKDDSLHGISRYFWIDSNIIIEETEYFSGRNKFIQKLFSKNGIPESEVPYVHGEINGTAKKYYPDGTLLEITEFKNGEFDGLRKYFHPNGQLWIEQIYKAGKNWTIVANYTNKGQRRDAGTLKNGNGTIIFYNDDNSVREVLSYSNGERIK